MGASLFSPFSPIVFGVLTGSLVYMFRHTSGRKRDVNYLTVFMNAAAIYVFVLMVVNHKLHGVSYSLMLDQGFGLEEATIAFIFSIYHFLREILLMTFRRP